MGDDHDGFLTISDHPPPKPGNCVFLEGDKPADRTFKNSLIGQVGPPPRRITLGADKAYDVRQFVKDPRERKITPHIAIDGRPSKPASLA